MTLTEVWSYVDRSIPEMVSDLLPLLRQPSISADGTGVAACAELLAGMMRREGITTRVMATPGQPVVVGHVRARPGAPTLLVYGHYDVQPVEPVSAWTSPPFEPTVRDGRVFCRGAADNKGQLWAQLMALRAWRAAGGGPPVNLTFLVDGEEESGSPHLPGFVRDHRELLAADAVYLSDGPVDASGRHRLALGVRGLLAIELASAGAPRDHHSGHFGNLLPNPAWELVKLLASLRGPDGRVAIDGFYDDVDQPTAAEAAAARALPVDLPGFLARHGVDRLATLPDTGFHERLMFQPTLNISGLAAGYTGPGNKTIIPATATARLDMRLVPSQHPDRIYARVRDHVARHSLGIRLRRVGGAVPPSRTPLDAPFVALVGRAVEWATGSPPLLLPSTGGTLPDHVFTGILGLPLVKVPYANVDEANHSPDENLAIDHFAAGVRIAAAVYAAAAELPQQHLQHVGAE
jgi:acetylornithine deacetylase/succinyl-diaminopimelate desuccinylase-like protein